MNALASAYRAAGKQDLALPLYDETLKLRKAVLGADHPDTLASLNRLALEYQAAGKLDLSMTLYEELLKLQTEKLGADNTSTLGSMYALANVYSEGLRFDRAIPLFEELLRIRRVKLPEGNKTRIDAQNHLGLHLLFAGRFAEAEPHLLATYRDGLNAKDFPKDWLRIYALRLVCLYMEWDKPAELTKWHAELDNLGGPADIWLTNMGLQLLQASRFRAAEFLLRECLDNREKMQPEYWTTFNTKSMLGGALLGQKKYGDAEPLLLAGYEGMKQREKSITPIDQISLSRAVDRLVELYTATDKRDQLNKWQAERSKYPPSTLVEPKP
jgi:tetratricopeptide (TPR) repeat protein